MTGSQAVPMYGRTYTRRMSKSKTVGVLNKDGVFGKELIELRRKTALANPNTGGLQETKELGGFSPFIYINFFIVLTLSVYKTFSMRV